MVYQSASSELSIPPKRRP